MARAGAGLAAVSGRLTRLILVRHGRTEWNRRGRLLGTADIPLDSLGRTQADAVATRLAGEPVDAVYASPLARAAQSAAPIAARHRLAVAVDDRLREIDFGEWQEETGEQAARASGDYDRWREDPGATTPPRGESLVELRDRVRSALEAIVTARPGGVVVVVTHGGAIRAALLVALALPSSAFFRTVIDHGSLTELQCVPEGQFITSLNDRCHLEGIAE